MGVRVAGAAALRRELRRAGADLAELKAAHERVSAYVAAAAAPRIPRRTGRLAATIRGNRAAGRASVNAGRASVPYAGVIHWGWRARRIRPNRFIYDTARDTEPVWLQFYQRDIERILAKVGGTY